MRVIATHLYFWPDRPACATIFGAITERWAQDGHEVTVLAGQPAYGTANGKQPARQTIGGVVVRRLAVLTGRDRISQALNMVWFPLAVSVRVLFGRRPDLVMCSTVPQVTLAFLVSWAAKLRGAAFVYHCQDIHPEIGELSGDFPPVAARVLAAMDLASMERSSRVVVLSEDMVNAVAARDSSLMGRTEIINNFPLPPEPVEPSPLPAVEPGWLRVVFTGNLGTFQGLEDIVDAAALASADGPVELVFMGQGRARDEIESRARKYADADNLRVRMLPSGSSAAARALMRSAHVGVVSLIPGIAAYCFPSKTATYAEEGLPMLVVCEDEAALSRQTRDQGLGWTAPPGDLPAIAEALVTAHAEVLANTWQQRSDRVRDFAHEAFDGDRLLDRWSHLAREVTAAGAGR